MRIQTMLGVLFAVASADIAMAAGCVLDNPFEFDPKNGKPPVTFQGLIKEGFKIVSAISTPAGPGMFLQRNNDVCFCVVAETPKSANLATRYCKPVN